MFILIGAVFLLTFFASAAILYRMLDASAEKQRIVSRLRAIQETSLQPDREALRVLKDALPSTLPLPGRLAAALPGIAQVSVFLAQAGVGLGAEAFLGLTLALGGAGALAPALFGLPWPLVPLCGLSAGAVPSVLCQAKRARRFRQFEELFPEAIDQLARAVRAGHAFTSGFELIGQELPDPVGQEFRTTFTQQNLGVPLPTALSNFATRMPLPDVRFFVVAIRIQRESGGNLGEVLDSLSGVVRERFKLLRQIRIYTAEGRASMYVLMAMPFVAGLGVYAASPGYMMPLFTDPRGQLALIVAAIMQVFGFLVIRRMIRIQV